MKRVSVGLDISMTQFHACLIVKQDDGGFKIIASRTFKNSEEGAEELLVWADKRNKGQIDVTYVMEATGCYYENLAHFLYNNERKVAVVLANRMKNYFKSLNIKTKTDKIDSKVIAQYGLERILEIWSPMSSNYKALRDLCRELLSQKKELQRAKNQFHAIRFSHQKAQLIKKLKSEQINFCEQIIKQLKQEINKLVDQDDELKSKLEKVCSIPGMGFETAVILACETNGFKMVKSIRQLVSYAGLDVSHYESGNYKGKSRISKKGNSRIRQALYMPALSAIRSNNKIKELYGRICEKNPNIKKKGIIAAMRKLLITTYVIWKKDEFFKRDYKWAA